MKWKIRNQDGYILATTLIVLVILVILSLSLISTSVSESTQSKYYERELQAKYLSKSGAEIMAEYIISNTEDFETKFLDKANNFPFVKDLNGGSVSVDVVKITEGVEIISEGTFENSTEKTRLFLKNIAIGNEPLFNTAIEIVDPSNTRYKNMLDDPIITNPTSKGILYQKHNDITINLDEDKKYNDIEVDNGYTLFINTFGEDRILIVNKLTINGFIKLSEDGGRVFIFVKTSASFKNSYKDNENQLILFGMNGSNIEISPSSDKDSFLYVFAPFASIKLSGNVKILGSIVSQLNNKPTIKESDVEYRLLNKPITINGYDLFDAQHLYEKDRYDNFSK